MGRNLSGAGMNVGTIDTRPMLDPIGLMPLFQSLDEERSPTWTHQNRRSVEFCLQILPPTTNIESIPDDSENFFYLYIMSLDQLVKHR